MIAMLQSRVVPAQLIHQRLIKSPSKREKRVKENRGLSILDIGLGKGEKRSVKCAFLKTKSQWR